MLLVKIQLNLRLHNLWPNRPATICKCGVGNCFEFDLPLTFNYLFASLLYTYAWKCRWSTVVHGGMTRRGMVHSHGTESGKCLGQGNHRIHRVHTASSSVSFWSRNEHQRALMQLANPPKIFVFVIWVRFLSDHCIEWWSIRNFFIHWRINGPWKECIMRFYHSCFHS